MVENRNMVCGMQMRGRCGGFALADRGCLLPLRVSQPTNVNATKLCYKKPLSTRFSRAAEGLSNKVLQMAVCTKRKTKLSIHCSSVGPTHPVS